MSALIASTHSTIKTTCAYCGVGCGIEAQVDPASRQVEVKGDQQHPANYGRLCSKGSALGETLAPRNRQLQPEINGQAVSWPQALDAVADGFRRIIEQHGPDAVAIYGSGQLLTEDYYVANKLMKGFIGTGNMDTNSRLCMASSVAGHKRAFGSDTVPNNYEDLELADLLVLVGSNTAWCHPVLFQRIRAAKARRPEMRIVVVDPRRTDSCDIADLHLPLAPGSDVLLFNGLLRHLADADALDPAYLAAHTEGFDATLQAARAEGDDAAIAQGCALALADLQRFYDWFTRTARTVTVYSQGVNQSSAGTDKVNAITNCHLATGRIGQAGSGPFSVTGQPNAMGGREVGGLANQLAAHMDFAKPEDVERVARFWQCEQIARKPGLTAVELFEAVHRGDVKAVWVMATNPVVSLPNADRVKEALQRCELVVVSDCISDSDTIKLAHIKLPAQGWSEKDGTVTNSERRISRQRALLPPLGEARPDWWIICEVAKRLGYAEAFDYHSSADIFREHARLSGFENGGSRDFDISAYADISDEAYQALAPFQWPAPPGRAAGTARLFAAGGFFTPNGRAKLLPVNHRPPVNAPGDDYPIRLNTGRIRDQWHTMTRTALAPRLNAHKPEPFLELNPADAERLGLHDGQLARIQSRWGQSLARTEITDAVRPGNAFLPMHWTEQLSRQGRINPIVNPELDPYSRQPELKHTPVQVAAYAPAWQGFAISRERLSIASDYQVEVLADHCVRYELADTAPLSDPRQWALALLGACESDDMLEYEDAGQGRYRLALVREDRLQAVVFIAPDQHLPERGWLTGLFGKPALSEDDRRALLKGEPSGGGLGKMVCACFAVPENTIRQAVIAQKLATPAEVGKCLKAGTNCGSCVPEIQRIIGSCASTA